MNYRASKIVAFLVTGLLSWSVQAEPDKTGVVRGIDAASHTIIIDEMRYKPAADVQIRNLAGGTDSWHDIQVNMRARYSLNEKNQLTELWLYSKYRRRIPGINEDFGDQNY